MIKIPLQYQPDSTQCLARLLDLPRPVLLHSADRTSQDARYDILSADPRHWLSSDGQCLYLDGEPQAGPVLRALARLVPAEGDPGPHFQTGFIGYLGYGLLHQVRRLGPSPADPTALPLLQGGLYAWSLVTDHQQQTTQLFADASLAQAYVEALRQRFTASTPTAQQNLQLQLAGPFTATPESHYRQAFARIQQYLRAGDCYQVNLARHFSAPVQPHSPWASWQLYQQLVQVQPGAFAAYLDTPQGVIQSFSPERLLRVAHDQGQRRALTAPIKGTAARDADPALDRSAALALQASGKNQAENLMIVDLLRNDLGQVCEPGSIRVDRLFELVSLRNVHHLVSTISGRPRPAVDALACLEALFPGGSITGAPKHRAMQIIDELEPVGRSVYCGAIGYLDRTGLLDMNIAIRSLVLAPDRIHLWGGGAIVAESELQAELAEINAKIGRLLQAVAASSNACNWA